MATARLVSANIADLEDRTAQTRAVIILEQRNGVQEWFYQQLRRS
jgi:hypothetical protein